MITKLKPNANSNTNENSTTVCPIANSKPLRMPSRDPCVIVAINILRDQKRREKNFLKYVANTPINIVEQPEQITELKEPLKYKEYYILRYKLNFKYKEIAEYKGISINSVSHKIREMRREFKEINCL